MRQSEWEMRGELREIRGTLEHVRQRFHDALYFNRPLTDEDLRQLARDVDRSLAA